VQPPGRDNGSLTWENGYQPSISSVDPGLVCRRISFDANDRTIEISDAEYPGDRTELRFITPLKPWPKLPEETNK
jgi:hypothetical protein